MYIYKDRYRVSACGDVYDTFKKRWLSKCRQSAGYIQVCIHGKLEYLHRIVCSVLYGDITGFEVDHLDHNKNNNCFTNLEPVTRIENMKRYNESSHVKVHTKDFFSYMGKISAQKRKEKKLINSNSSS